MILQRAAKPSLTPFELAPGDALAFTRESGAVWTLTLTSTRAAVLAGTPGAVTAYEFTATVDINGTPYDLRREVGTQASFYEPWAIDGVHVWLDAVGAIFREGGDFMGEKDWRHGQVCQPRREARFAIQEAGRSICPEPMALWYENPRGAIRIEECYNGEDCWMGPYEGANAHCGLDINMPAGTRLYAPIDFDTQYYFNSVAANFNNNRWRGMRRWPDGSEWILQSHHLIELLVEQDQSLGRGTPYATTAGVWVGAHEHTHFVFRVLEQGGEYFLDPWLLFWQMFRDASDRA